MENLNIKFTRQVRREFFKTQKLTTRVVPNKKKKNPKYKKDLFF